ncbi:MAG: hypothetical protein U0132_05385 [Gemmatimonadaceae bacterium]
MTVQISPEQAIDQIVTSTADAYQSARAKQRIYREQLSQLEEKRLAIARRLREGQVTGPDKAGLEARLTELDQRIATTDKAIADADAQVAQTAGAPGAIQIDMPRGSDVPDEAIVFGGLIGLALVLPISIAFARRIVRRGHVAPTLTKDLDERFTRLEQALDAVAIEVERVGESQRYYSKMLGPGAAQPIEVHDREAVRQQR